MGNAKTIKRKKKTITIGKYKMDFIKASSIVYDEDLDILEAYTSNTTEYSKNIKDFIIIHFSKGHKLTGLEFLDISQNFNIPKKVLNSLKSLEMSICIKEGEKIVILSVRMLSIINKEQTNINFITTSIDDKLECSIC